MNQKTLQGSVNMLTKNFEELRVCVAINNITSDACNISSLADGEDCMRYMNSKYGIPEILTGILESFLVKLQPSEAIQFFTSLLDSIACNGKDLTKVSWEFLASELRNLPKVDSEVQAAIKGMDLLSEGKPWPDACQTSQAASAASIVSARFVCYSNYNYFANCAAHHSAQAAIRSSFSYFASTSAACVARAAAEANCVARAGCDDFYTAYRERQRAILLKFIAEAPTPP